MNSAEITRFEELKGQIEGILMDFNEFSVKWCYYWARFAVRLGVSKGLFAYDRAK